jgi:hypothetical protein
LWLLKFYPYEINSDKKKVPATKILFFKDKRKKNKKNLIMM